MRSRRHAPTTDIVAAVEMDPWKDDRIRDFVAINTIQRLRAYHQSAGEPMPPIAEVHASRARNLLLLDPAEPDYRPCQGECRPTRAELRARRRAKEAEAATPTTRGEANVVVAEERSASSSETSDDSEEEETHNRHSQVENAALEDDDDKIGGRAKSSEDNDTVATCCAVDRARALFFGASSFISSTSPRHLVNTPHVPMTTPSVATERPSASRRLASLEGVGDGTVDAQRSLRLDLEEHIAANSTPLRQLDAPTPPVPLPLPPPLPVLEDLPSPSIIAAIEVSPATAPLDTTPVPERPALYPAPSAISGRPLHQNPGSPSSSPPPPGRGYPSCAVCHTIAAYFESLLLRGVVLDRFNQKDLAFAWWVLGRNMDTAALDHWRRPMRREALLITVRNFYYTLLTAEEKRAAKAKEEEAEKERAEDDDPATDQEADYHKGDDDRPRRPAASRAREQKSSVGSSSSGAKATGEGTPTSRRRPVAAPPATSPSRPTHKRGRVEDEPVAQRGAVLSEGDEKVTTTVETEIKEPEPEGEGAEAEAPHEVFRLPQQKGKSASSGPVQKGARLDQASTSTEKVTEMPVEEVSAADESVTSGVAESRQDSLPSTEPSRAGSVTRQPSRRAEERRRALEETWSSTRVSQRSAARKAVDLFTNVSAAVPPLPAIVKAVGPRGGRSLPKELRGGLREEPPPTTQGKAAASTGASAPDSTRPKGTVLATSRRVDGLPRPGLTWPGAAMEDGKVSRAEGTEPLAEAPLRSPPVRQVRKTVQDEHRAAPHVSLSANTASSNKKAEAVPSSRLRREGGTLATAATPSSALPSVASTKQITTPLSLPMAEAMVPEALLTAPQELPLGLSEYEQMVRARIHQRMAAVWRPTPTSPAPLSSGVPLASSYAFLLSCFYGGSSAPTTAPLQWWPHATTATDGEAGAPIRSHGRRKRVEGGADPSLFLSCCQHDQAALEQRVETRLKNANKEAVESGAVEEPSQYPIKDDHAERDATKLSSSHASNEATLSVKVESVNEEEQQLVADPSNEEEAVQQQQGHHESMRNDPSSSLLKTPFDDLSYGQQCLLVWEAAGLLEHHEQRKAVAKARRERAMARRRGMATRRMAALAAAQETVSSPTSLSTPSSQDSSASTSDSSDASSSSSGAGDDDADGGAGTSEESLECGSGAPTTPARLQRVPRHVLDYWAAYRDLLRDQTPVSEPVRRSR